MPTPKRSEAFVGIKQEEGESKKRIRKIEDAGRRNSQRATGEDALDSDVLTRKVWDEVYELFKLHFSTEMPFIHAPSFKIRVRQAWPPKDPSAPATYHQDGRVLFLGVLTLTARFHPELVRRHSPNPQQLDPIAASDYYASALADAFGPTLSGNLSKPSLEGIQALLMLALYEWGQTKGLSAWVHVGIATRLAQSMGLPYVDDPRPRTPKQNGASKSLPTEGPTEKEIWRRTWWSCFIMDRMLSAGKCRPTMIDVDKLRVQLPRAEDQFLFVRPAEPGFLSTRWLGENSPAEVNDGGNVLSCYIRLVEIFGRFSEWSYAGGRRTEKLPPWDRSTEFFKIRHDLETFYQALPSDLAFTDAHISAHIASRTATAYASMHSLYLLCLIMLHREYIPFVPLRSQKPSGPLDEPRFPPEEYDTPKGFWEESTEIIFKSARDLIQLVKTCKEEGALPESPQIGFAVWQASFVCLYGAHFPFMDTGNHVQSGGSSSGSGRSVNTKETSDLLKDFVPTIKMVKVYQNTLAAMHKFYTGVKQEWQDHIHNGKPLTWSGGHGDVYLTHEKALKEVGSLSDGSETTDQPRSRASTNDIGTVPAANGNGEPMQGVEAASAPAPTSRSNGAGAWAPINQVPVNASPPPDVGERGRYTPGGAHPYGAPQGYVAGLPYQQSPSQSTLPPSLASPSNGDSSGLSSPYAATVAAQQYNVANQMPHAGPYPVAQHAEMAPPTQMGGVPPDVWLKYYESLNMGGMDNMPQDHDSSLLPHQGEPYASGYWEAINPASYAPYI